MDEQYADILQVCLTRIEAGASVEECLAAYPAERAVLEGPLRAAVRLRQHPWPDMPSPTRAAIQSRLRSQVAAYRTGTVPVAPPAAPSPALPSAPPAGFDPGALLGD